MSEDVGVTKKSKKELATQAANDSAGRFVDIIEALNHRTPPDCDPSRIEDLCKTVLASPERVMAVRALMAAVVSKENPYRITGARFAQMYDTGAWPAFIYPGPDPETIRKFIAQEQEPRVPRIMAGYLYGLAILARERHPCFDPPIPAVLARYCEPVRALERLSGLGGEDRTSFNLFEVARLGHEFYHLMGRGGHGVSEAAFGPVLRSDFFSGLRPATSDADLENRGFREEWTAIRLGLSGENYVASKLSLSLVRTPGKEGLAETFIYVRTWMRPTRSSPSVIRSHGFLLPRNTQLYVAQYHLQGYGLNIITLSHGQLADRDLRFRAGLILAVDRQHNMGSLASRIAFVRLKRPDLMIGDFNRDELRNQLARDRTGVNPDELTDYLHSIGEVSIKAPLRLDDDRQSPAELISTWREMATYLARPDVAKRIAALNGAENDLAAYLHKPLRGP